MGTQVEKGDFLVRLDDSALQKDLLTQRIDVHQAKATLVQAEADVTKAIKDYRRAKSELEKEKHWLTGEVALSPQHLPVDKIDAFNRYSDRA